MTAVVLREAAALMRERAEAATAPQYPWALNEDDTEVRARRGAGPTVVTTVPLGYEERRANAAHVASWHPAVALAVADWLEQMAVSWNLYENHAIRNTAIVTARTYLGGAR